MKSLFFYSLALGSIKSLIRLRIGSDTALHAAEAFDSASTLGSSLLTWKQDNLEPQVAEAIVRPIPWAGIDIRSCSASV
jgi:hypothetical protein